MSLALKDYDYELPPELIADRPLERRDASRMMVLHREDERIEHRIFSDLPAFIAPGDLLVLNDTRVMAARRFSDDGTFEFLYIEQLGSRRWRCMVRPGRKMKCGTSVVVGGEHARVDEVCANGDRIISLDSDANLFEGGLLPLPLYMQRQSDAADAERYQTVFGTVPGALAAPTAGLHFTPELLGGLPHAFITLHVGTGTFRPVKTEDISEHQMHAERFWISDTAASKINAARRVLAVGTTSVRVLESARRDGERLVAQENATDIFIHPPQKVRQVGALITNFHLPRSTLLMLVSAFAGREFVLAAYAEAIRERYRFYSYGDCMLIV